jgi:tetratricopeptide (TPR) repeat protein
MRLPRFVYVVLVLFFFLPAFGQNTRIVIPAGTPEDKELSAIAAEGNADKREAAYKEFIDKYADNKAAVAYAEWQLSQQYQTAGDNATALEWGDKALQAYPNDLDIIVSDTNIAMTMKDNGKVVDYAVKGAAVYHSIAEQPKPADLSDELWKRRIAEEEGSAKSNYDFLETAAYNAIAAEQDANKRMTYIEKFTPAFPKSQFDQQVTQLAMLSLQQLNQPQRLEVYGEKALAANPDSIPTLLMLANAYAGDPKQASKAAKYADKVISLVGANPTDPTKKSYAGLAHTAAGRADLNLEKLPSATTELKSAVTLLQGDPADQQAALYYLGYASAKQNRKAECVAALEKAAAINGPYQAPAKEMLAKVQAAGKK